jgi:polar amino acid transport system substrate-binding protein
MHWHINCFAKAEGVRVPDGTQPFVSLTRGPMSLKRARKSLCFALAVTCAVLGAAPARADLLDDIKQKHEITIATEARFAPYEYVQDGKIVGYGTEMLHMILGKLEGVKVNQLDLPFQGILPGLTTGKWDLGGTSIVITKARSEHFAFTLPIGDATAVLLKRKGDTTIMKPEDLNGKIVGSQAGSAHLQTAHTYSDMLQKKGGKGIAQIKEYTDFDSAYADLAAGRIQAVVQSLSNLGPIIKARPDTFEIINVPLGPKVYFAWAVRKSPDTDSLRQYLDKGLLDLKHSGKMAEMQKQWFGFTMDLPDTVPAPDM